MSKSILELKKGEKAEVVAFAGGEGMRRRLENMGIRPGKIISRVSSQMMSGPVTVRVEGRETAMGRGIAAKIEVKLKEKQAE